MLSALDAAERALAQLELPRLTAGAATTTRDLEQLLRNAICRWSTCRPDDRYLLQYILEQRGAQISIRSVQPEWLCGGANRTAESLLQDDALAAERIAASLTRTAAFSRPRNRSVLLDLTDRCTLDVLIDSCSVPLLCHVRRPGSCAIPIPYRDYWTRRYASVARSLLGPLMPLRTVQPYHSLYWRGQPRHVCSSPPLGANCQRTRLAWLSHQLCTKPFFLRRRGAPHESRHLSSPITAVAAAAATDTACRFDAKLVAPSDPYFLSLYRPIALAFFDRHQQAVGAPCVSWRHNSECSAAGPSGPRFPLYDRPCDFAVLPAASGYCE